MTVGNWHTAFKERAERSSCDRLSHSSLANSAHQNWTNKEFFKQTEPEGEPHKHMFSSSETKINATMNSNVSSCLLSNVSLEIIKAEYYEVQGQQEDINVLHPHQIV